MLRASRKIAKEKTSQTKNRWPLQQMLQAWLRWGLEVTAAKVSCMVGWGLEVISEKDSCMVGVGAGS